MDQSPQQVLREPNVFVLEEQIKQLQRDVNNGFNRLEEQMKALLQFHRDELDDHEDRIRVLEKSVWKWMGMASVIGTLLGIVGSWAVKQLG